jgi:hypothetical protein
VSVRRWVDGVKKLKSKRLRRMLKIWLSVHDMLHIVSLSFIHLRQNRLEREEMRDRREKKNRLKRERINRREEMGDM